MTLSFKLGHMALLRMCSSKLKKIYDQMMWIGFKPFKITNIKQESEDIKSFTVETEEYDFSEFTQANTSQLMFLVINFHIELNVTILSYQVIKSFNFWR